MQKMSRRTFAAVAALAACAAPLALAGCGGTTQEAPKEETAAPADAPAAETPAADAPAADGSYTLVTEGALTFASSPDYPPFENLSEDGEDYVGFEVDLIREIGARMGLDVVIKPLQFDAIIPAIVAGGQYDVGVSGFSVEPDRAKQIDFTRSYYIDDMAIIVNTGGDLTAENVEEALNAPERTIAAQSGTTGEDFAKENFPEATVKGYGGANDTFAALQAGQVDAVCTNYAVGVAAIEAYPEQEVVHRVATGEEYAMVVSKDNPNLTAAIDAVIDEMEADGKLKELLEAWNLA